MRIAVSGCPHLSAGLHPLPGVELFHLPALPATAQRWSQAAFERGVQSLRASLDVAGELDAAWLHLPGSLQVEGQEDADGLLLAEVRASLSLGTQLGASFPRSADLSPLMVRTADLLAGNPETGMALLARARAGEVQPVMALSRPPLCLDPGSPALPELEGWLRELEQEPGILHLALTYGSAALDEPRMGAAVLVVADADHELAAEVAEHAAEEIWSRREALALPLPPRDWQHLRRPFYPLDSFER